MCIVFFKVILCNSRALPDGRTHVPNTPPPHYQFIPIKYANRFSGSFLASMNVRTNKNLKEPHYHIKKREFIMWSTACSFACSLSTHSRHKIAKATQMVELMWIMPINSSAFIRNVFFYPSLLWLKNFFVSLLIADIYVYHYKGC